MFISIVSRNLLKVGEVIMSAGMMLMGGGGSEFRSSEISLKISDPLSDQSLHPPLPLPWGRSKFWSSETSLKISDPLSDQSLLTPYPYHSRWGGGGGVQILVI